VDLRLWGIRPSVLDMLLWRAGRRSAVRMVAVPTTAVLFQGAGRRR
jgi:2-polyprenyl-6-hydroxyphenyl methylase/3-demethylubiquinone-9 3-methyltransferase